MVPWVAQRRRDLEMEGLAFGGGGEAGCVGGQIGCGGLASGHGMFWPH